MLTGYSSNSSNISGYVNIDEITFTHRYTRTASPEHKILGNDTMETASTEVMPI